MYAYIYIIVCAYMYNLVIKYNNTIHNNLISIPLILNIMIKKKSQSPSKLANNSYIYLFLKKTNKPIKISFNSNCSCCSWTISLLLMKRPFDFSTGSARVPVAFAFSAQVFVRVVFKGASSCFLSGYLPGPDKEAGSRLFPPASRAAASAAALTSTGKRLSQHWRSRLFAVKRHTERAALEKYVDLCFSLVCYSRCRSSFTYIPLLYVQKKGAALVVVLRVSEPECT